MKEALVIAILSLAAAMALRHFGGPEWRSALSRSLLIWICLLPFTVALSPNYLVFAVILVITYLTATRAYEDRLSAYIAALFLLPSMSYLITSPPPINQLVEVNSAILLSIGALFGLVAGTRPRQYNFAGADALIIGIIIVFLLISVRGTSMTNLLRGMVQSGLAVFLPYYIVSRGLRTSADFRTFLLATIMAGAVLGLIAFFESSRGWLLYDDAERAIAHAPEGSAYAKQRGGFLRSRGPFVDSTAFGLFFGVTFTLLFAIRKTLSRIVFYVAMIGIGAGLIYTFARVGLITASVGALACLLWERRYGVIAFIAMSAPLLWATLEILARVVPPLKAALGFSGDAAGSIDYRWQILDRGLDVMRMYPLLGISTWRVPEYFEDLRQGEGIIDFVNTPIAIGVMSGSVGLILFYLPTLVTIWRLHGFRTLKDDMHACRGAIFGALIALHAGLLTTTYLGRNGLVMFILLGAGAAATRRVVRRNMSSIPKPLLQRPA